MRFSKSELELIENFSNYRTGFGGLVSRWAVEIVPPVALIIIGITTGSQVYPIAAVLVLVFFNVFRLVRQNSIAVELKSISEKILGSNSEQLDSYET